LTVEELAAKRVFGLEAGDQDGVAGVANVVAEMMKHAAGFGHTGGRNDHARDPDIIERFGLFHVADIAETAKAEGVVTAVEEGVGFDVVTLRVGAKGFGDVYCEGAIYKDGYLVDFAFRNQFVDHKYDLLRAADGKSGRDDFAAPAGRVIDDFGELLLGVKDGLMEAVAVGAFHDEYVGLAGEFRVADDGEALAADVAGEQQFFAFQFDFEERRTQHVARFVRGGKDSGKHFGAGVHRDVAKLGERGFGVAYCVERFDGSSGSLLNDPAAAGGAAVEEVGVFFLDEGGIEEHGAAKVARGGGGEDGTLETAGGEVREVAGVVDVGVGEDNGVDFGGGEGEVFIALGGFRAAALIHAAIEEEAPDAGLNLVHGAGDGARGAAESDLHNLMSVPCYSQVSLFMRKVLITLAALLPSLWLFWQAGGIPHLGYFHDDGLYAGTAAALADGRGLRVESLPGEPWQVKYPPVFPLYLALGVKWEQALQFLVWLPLPLLLWQVWRWRGDAVLVVLLGWNIFSVVFAGTTLSEVLATALLLASIRDLEAGKTRRAAVFAGVAYLTRTALIALPVGAVLWLLMKRRWREAGVFAAIFAPFFLGWSAFVATHSAAGVKGGSVYYLSYGQFFRDNMNWGILPRVLSVNAQELVGSLGELLFFNGGDSFWEVNFARVLVFGAVAGLARQGARPYSVVAVVYLGLLTVWNFVPNARFVFPLLPLLLDGLLTELRHFRDMLKVTWTTQRGATIVIGALVAAGALWTIQRNSTAAWAYTAAIPLQYRELAADRELAYAWIRANTPVEANFLVYEDPALRRHTGRHGIGIHCPTRLFYANDTKAILAYHAALITHMRDENLQYLLIGPNDLSQDLVTAAREKVLTDWKTRTDLETVYENARFRVRRLRPIQSGM